MVRVQPNHGRGGRAAAKAFGMPHAEVSVRSLKSEWPFPIGCSILPTAYCWKDCGLCCYAVACPLCVHAEVAVQNDIKGFCGAESMMMQILGVLGIESLVFPFAMCAGCLLTCGLAPWVGVTLCGIVRGAYHTQIRDGFKHKYGLPDDEFCFSYTMTTYVCWTCPGILDCTSCAAYQMAYFMKYDAPNKQDLECCCYKMLCLPMCSPSED